MRQAREASLEDSFPDMLCSLVINCGLGDERVLEMPYLRAKCIMEFAIKQNKTDSNPEEPQRPKTFG